MTLGKLAKMTLGSHCITCKNKPCGVPLAALKIFKVARARGVQFIINRTVFRGYNWILGAIFDR